jgi:hypothetical protein
MITISIAQFFINLSRKKAVQGGDPACPVLKGPKRISVRMRVASLLPVGVQKRAITRRIAQHERQALRRLAETSPHLLLDIGVVPHQLATYDGATPQERNANLTWPSLGMRSGDPIAAV